MKPNIAFILVSSVNVLFFQACGSSGAPQDVLSDDSTAPDETGGEDPALEDFAGDPDFQEQGETGDPVEASDPPGEEAGPEGFDWTRQFLIGGWGTPPPEFLNAGRIDEMNEAGLNAIVASPWYDMEARAYNLEFLGLAAAGGLDVGLFDPGFTLQPDLSTAAALAAIQPYLESEGARAIACWVLWDEPNASLFPGIGTTARSMTEADPLHPQAVNLFPAYASAEQLGTSTYDEYVSRYVSEVGLEHLMVDTYPYLWTEAALPGLMQKHFETLETTSSHADIDGIPLHVWVQSIESTGGIPLDEPKLRFGVASSVAYGAKGIFYFTFWTPPESSEGLVHAVIEPDGTRGGIFDSVAAVNRELQAVGDFLMQLTHRGTFHQAASGYYSGTQLVATDPANDLIEYLAEDEAFAGLFRHADGRDVIIVANKNVGSGYQVDVAFKRNLTAAWTVSMADGSLIPIAPTGPNVVRVTLPAGWMNIVLVELM